MDTGVKILLGLAAVGVGYAVYKSRQNAQLQPEPNPNPPAQPPQFPPVINPPGTTAPPVTPPPVLIPNIPVPPGTTPPFRVPQLFTVGLNTPSGVTNVVPGDRIQLQGIPQTPLGGSPIVAVPPENLVPVGQDTFLISGPVRVTVAWVTGIAADPIRTVLFQSQ